MAWVQRFFDGFKGSRFRGVVRRKKCEGAAFGNRLSLVSSSRPKWRDLSCTLVSSKYKTAEKRSTKTAFME